MHFLNVSNFNNNSGLYALALVASLAIEENEARLDTIPGFVRKISYADVASTEEPTETGNGRRQLCPSCCY